MEDEALAVRRYLLMVRAMLEEEDATQRSVAERLGVTQPSLHGWLADPPRQKPKLDKIQRAIDRVPLAPAYFFDPDADENYRRHVVRSRPAGVRLVRDVDPAIVDYESVSGPLPSFVREALDLKRASLGAGAITATVVALEVSSYEAAMRGTKTAARPADPDATIDESRGQRKAPKRKPRV